MDRNVFNKILTNVFCTVSLWKIPNNTQTLSVGSLECIYVNRNLGSLKLPQCLGATFDDIFTSDTPKTHLLKLSFEESLQAIQTIQIIQADATQRDDKVVEINTFEDLDNVITRIFMVDDKTVCCLVIDKGPELDLQNRVDFIADIGNEIRSPLNSIIAMTDLFIDTPLTSEQFDYIDTIRHNSYSLMSTVNDILDFTELVLHKIQLESKPCLLRKCIQSSIDIISSRLHDQHVDLAFSIDTDVPICISSDEYRLQQVIITIITNTVKYRNRNGKIRLYVKSRKAEYTSTDHNLTSEKVPAAHHEIEFGITDSVFGLSNIGTSLDRTLLDRIKTAQPKQYSCLPLGLGFTLVEYLVELFNGRFWIECPPTGGVTFYFTIMCSECAPVELPSDDQVDNTPIAFAGKTALLCDDDLDSRMAISTLLLKWKIQPILASSIKEALMYLQSTTELHAVFVDSAHSDYLEATIKKLRPTSIPIVVMNSASVNTKMPNHYYLPKPVKENHLLYICKQLFSKDLSSSTTTTNSDVKILLVDSVSSQEKVLKSTLLRLGYANVDVAYDGHEALRMFSTAVAQKPYDIVLLGDLKIPKMSGCELSAEISRWGEKHGIPAGAHSNIKPIILACATNVSRAEKSRQCKYINGFIPKPIFSNTLDRILQSMLNQRKDSKYISLA